MPFVVYPSSFFGEDSDAADQLSFNSDYFKLPFEADDVAAAVGNLTTVLNEHDLNITNPNLPTNLQKPIPSILILLLPKNSPIWCTDVLDLFFTRAANYQITKIISILPDNDEEQESVLQVRMDRNQQLISMLVVDCWPFSKNPKEAATTALSVAQKMLKNGQVAAGNAVRARNNNNGGGSVRREKTVVGTEATDEVAGGTKTTNKKC